MFRSTFPKVLHPPCFGFVRQPGLLWLPRGQNAASGVHPVRGGGARCGGVWLGLFWSFVREIDEWLVGVFCFLKEFLEGLWWPQCGLVEGLYMSGLGVRLCCPSLIHSCIKKEMFWGTADGADTALSWVLGTTSYLGDRLQSAVRLFHCALQSVRHHKESRAGCRPCEGAGDERFWSWGIRLSSSIYCRQNLCRNTITHLPQFVKPKKSRGSTSLLLRELSWAWVLACQGRGLAIRKMCF